VGHRDGVAIALASGAPLAAAPHHWSDGCPVLVEPRAEGGPPVVTRSYLDPTTGAILYAEVALADAPQGFEMRPDHWAGAGAKGAT
jgi:N-methylhydantoinase B